MHTILSLACYTGLLSALKMQCLSSSLCRGLLPRSFSLQLAHTGTLCAPFPNAHPTPPPRASHTGSSLHSQVPFHPSFARHRLIPYSHWPTVQPYSLTCCIFRCCYAFACVILQAWQEIPATKYLHGLSFKYFILCEHAS